MLSIAIAVAIALALDVAGRTAAASLHSATDTVASNVDLQLAPTRASVGFDEMQFRVVRSESRGPTRDLTIFDLLAIAVGCGAIANALGISVARRANEIGTLRMLGVTRAAIFRTFLAEGSLYGAIGSLAGLGLGQVLATMLVPHLLSRHRFERPRKITASRHLAKTGRLALRR